MSEIQPNESIQPSNIDQIGLLSLMIYPILLLFLNVNGSFAAQNGGDVLGEGIALFMGFFIVLPIAFFVFIPAVMSKNKDFISINLSAITISIFTVYLFKINLESSFILILSFSVVFFYFLRESICNIIRDKNLIYSNLIILFVYAQMAGGWICHLALNSIWLFYFLKYCLDWKKIEVNYFYGGLFFGLLIAICMFPMIYSLLATASQSNDYQKGIVDFRLNIYLIYFSFLAVVVLLSNFKFFDLFFLGSVVAQIFIFSIYDFQYLAKNIALFLHKQSFLTYFIQNISNKNDLYQYGLFRNKWGWHSSLIYLMLTFILYYTLFFVFKNVNKNWLKIDSTN